MDHDSGQVLAAHSAQVPLPPASLTKLAAVYVLFQQLREGKLKELIRPKEQDLFR